MTSVLSRDQKQLYNSYNNDGSEQWNNDSPIFMDTYHGSRNLKPSRDYFDFYDILRQVRFVFYLLNITYYIHNIYFSSLFKN